MSASLILTIAGLSATGMYLITSRTLSRIILGFSILGHAAVIALLSAGGRPGAVPIADGTTATDGSALQFSNPIPQALALTAIVISFGLTLFLLALARRQQFLTGDDLVEDDVEDRRVSMRPLAGAPEAAMHPTAPAVDPVPVGGRTA